MNNDHRIFSEGVFTVKFNGDGLLTAEIVAECLEGWSGIYHRVPSILAQNHPAFRHLRMVLFVEAIDHGSLTAKIIARLTMKDDESAAKLERDIDALADLAKQAFLENIKNMNTGGKLAVAAAVGGALALGAANLCGYYGQDAQNTISNSSNSIINNGAIYFSADPDEFMRMVGRATKDNARLTKQTISALRPSSVLGGDVNVGEEGQNLIVSSDAAKIIGSTNAEDLKPRIETRNLRHTPVIIRALDLDKKNSGWAAVIPSISPKRIRITLADNVSIQAAGNYFADADVDIAIDLDGNETPKKAHISAIQP